MENHVEKKAESQVEEKAEIQVEAKDQVIEKVDIHTEADTQVIEKVDIHTEADTQVIEKEEGKAENQKEPDSKKPVTVKVIKHKELQSLAAFADMLETIAKKLKEEQQFTFIQGEKSVVVTPSDQVKVEIEYETRGDKHSFEIEFEWYSGQSQLKQAKIE